MSSCTGLAQETSEKERGKEREIDRDRQRETHTKREAGREREEEKRHKIESIPKTLSVQIQHEIFTSLIFFIEVVLNV